MATWEQEKNELMSSPQFKCLLVLALAMQKRGYETGEVEFLEDTSELPAAKIVVKDQGAMYVTLSNPIKSKVLDGVHRFLVQNRCWGMWGEDFRVLISSLDSSSQQPPDFFLATGVDKYPESWKLSKPDSPIKRDQICKPGDRNQGSSSQESSSSGCGCAVILALVGLGAGLVTFFV